MWSQFALVFFVAFVFLYLPGTLLLRSASFRWFESLIFAPVISFLAFFILAAVYSITGVPCGWVTLFLPVCFFAFICCVLASFIKKGKLSFTEEAPTQDWAVLILGILISSLIVVLVFVKNLDGPASFVQEYDNTTHMSVLRLFVETNDYSLFNFAKYEVGSTSPTGIVSVGLYPSLWHCFVAMVLDCVSCSIPIAINAVNSLLSAVVFPSAIMLLVKVIFLDKKMYYASAIAAVACGGFPWLFLIFGPLYANIAAFSLLPLVLVAFVLIFSKLFSFEMRIRWSLLFLLACIATAFAQPNALFSAVLFLSPFCASLIWNRSKRSQVACNLEIRAIAFVLIFVCCVAFLWIALYKAPFMQGVVQFTWPALFSKSQAVVNAVSLSFTEMNAAQWVLAIIVLLGVIYPLLKKKYYWVVVAYLIVLVIYVVNASTDGELKHLLSGFWYTDTYRIGAMAAIFSIPVACMGFVVCYDFIKVLVEKCLLKDGNKLNSVALSFFLAGAFICVNYWPSYTNPGNQEVRTGFGAIGEKIASLNSEAVPHMLDPDEADFAKKVEEVVPEGALIINSPNDGSVFLYALDGLNIFYRDLEGDRGSRETKESEIVRNNLSDYASSQEVQEAVSSLGAQYVLILDQGDPTQFRAYLSNYHPEEWEGIESITDKTLGFEIVLAQDDMRLYKIVS